MLKIFTGGTFDLFHQGHINLLRRCKELGRVIVSLNTDEFVKEYKGNAPICTYEERKSVLLGCKYVDEVVPNLGGADSKPAIEYVNPDYILVGSDWAEKDYYKQMSFTQSWLDERNIGLIYVPYSREISTTEIKKRIQ